MSKRLSDADLVGEGLAAPYNFTWTNVPVGRYRVSARAIDNLGGATDSGQIAITVATKPTLSSSAKINAGLFQFALSGDTGFTYVIQQSSNLVNWTIFTTVTNATGTITVQDSTVAGQSQRFYRALVQ